MLLISFTQLACNDSSRCSVVAFYGRKGGRDHCNQFSSFPDPGVIDILLDETTRRVQQSFIATGL
jgi:hypothetical protein